MSRRILIVEDDAETADYLAKSLRQDGFTVEHVADGRDGLIMGSGSDFDLIVTDRMLPTMDGLSVVKALRAAGVETPVLILSALAQIDERVKGLRAGGDDYITKPFAYSEVVARIENLLRRRPGKAVETELRCGDLSVDLLSRRVTRGGRSVDLLPREFKLLEYLLRHKDKVVTRTMLLEQVWDYRFDPHPASWTPTSAASARRSTKASTRRFSIRCEGRAIGCPSARDPPGKRDATASALDRAGPRRHRRGGARGGSRTDRHRR